MNDGRFSKIALPGGVHGIRRKGRLKKCWIDSTKEDCGALGVMTTQTAQTAQDRYNWRTAKNGLPMHVEALPGHK